MNLIKVGSTVINLDYLISITQSSDTQLTTVVTTAESNTYDSRSDYGLLYKFLAANSTPYKKDVIAGVNITTVYVEEDNDSDNTVEQLVETGVHVNDKGVTSVEFAPGKRIMFA